MRLLLKSPCLVITASIFLTEAERPESEQEFAMSITRRDFVKMTGIGAGALALPGVLAGCVNKAVNQAVLHGEEALLNADPNHLANYFEQQFGVTATMMREVLSTGLAQGGDFCELYFQHSRSTSVALEDGAVNRASSSISLGMGVRVLKGDQTGYAYTEVLERADMIAAAKAAAVVASGAARLEPKAFAVGQVPDRYPTTTWWSDVSVDRRVPILNKLNKLAYAQDPRVTKVRASLADDDKVVLIANSLGQVYADRQPMVVVRLSCTAEDKAAKEENYDSFAARAGIEVIDDEKLQRMAKNAVSRALVNFKAHKPPAGELPVVLSSGSAGILLHEAIGHGMEADFNRKGVSVFADKIGQPIAEKFVNIIDDGTVLANRGAINLDDEGAPGQKTMLVENGILRTYMHDRISAQHYKVKTTGSGRRQSFRHIPMPRMRATYMMDGPHTRDEIIASVKKGVICDTFTNGQVNIGAGDFTFYVKNGQLIEDGKITAPIKDFNIIGNGPDVLRKVTHAANDSRLDSYAWTCGKNGQSVPVGLGMPTCLVSSITVGGLDKKA